MKGIVESINESINVKKLLFDEIRKLLKKNKLSELPAYAAYNVGDGTNRVYEITKKGSINYTSNMSIESLEYWVNDFEQQLKSGYLLKFEWCNEGPYEALFLPCSNKDKDPRCMYAQFDIKNGTRMQIEYNIKNDSFLVYMNVKMDEYDRARTDQNLKVLSFDKLK